MVSYKDSGVDVEAGYEAVKLIKNLAKNTMRPEVVSDIGSFGGLFALNKEKYNNPVLVSGTDGVGTKLKIAFLLDKHDTIGIDCVAMCVNDILCSGAEPLFFLDYIACGKNKPERIAEIVKGVVDGCTQSGCTLIGGETAEMPGFYDDNEYDIAGFAVGIVDRDKIIDGKKVKEGDKIIGFASSGLHSNGFSLVRKLLNPSKERLNEFIQSLGEKLGCEILKPTRIYVKEVLDIISKYDIKSLAHITGGGFIENIPRALPNGLKAKIFRGSWPVLPIFELLKSIGSLKEVDMFNTFNMGIGMIAVVSNEVADEIVNYMKNNYPDLGTYVIGIIEKGETGVDLC